MCAYAVKLTRHPEDEVQADMEKLRTLGLSDEQIISVVLITCQYNFSNRVTQGLGVDPPPGRSMILRRWLTGPAVDLEWLKYENDESTASDKQDNGGPT